MPMPNRKITGEPYRYGYQGQEKDAETGKEAFQLRLWDSRIGRWLTTDPYGEFSSPYLGIGNNPISLTDPDGGCTSCGIRPEVAIDIAMAAQNQLNTADLGTLYRPFTVYDFFDNLTGALNGGELWSQQVPEYYNSGERPPQLIGTLGVSGGAKILSNTSKAISQSINKTDELLNLLKPIDEFDTTVTLFRGTTGSEASSSIMFLTDNASVAATYIKNAGSVHSYKISAFALEKLKVSGNLEILKGIHGTLGKVNTEFKFIGKDLVNAINSLGKPF
jgi:RHS repeat-associated protein